MLHLSAGAKRAALISLLLLLLFTGAVPTWALDPVSPQAIRTFIPSKDGYAVRQWACDALGRTNHDGEGLQVQSRTDDFTRSYLKSKLSPFSDHQAVSAAALRLYKTARPDGHARG